MTCFIRVFNSAGLDEGVGMALGRLLSLEPQRRERHAITFRCESISVSRRQELDHFCSEYSTDYALLPSDSSLCEYRVLAFDMDSTLIAMESIDEIAALAGLRAEVAVLTDAAIEGRVTSYAESVRARIHMLRGIHSSDIFEMVGRKLVLTPGAVELVAAAKIAGLRTIIISGGFQIVARMVQQLLAIDESVAHELEFENGKLTGRIQDKVIDADGKVEILKTYCERYGILPKQVIAIGDGANDIGMANFSGLFAGFRPKATLRRFCSVVLDHHGLDGLLLAVGTKQYPILKAATSCQ